MPLNAAHPSPSKFNHLFSSRTTAATFFLAKIMVRLAIIKMLHIVSVYLTLADSINTHTHTLHSASFQLNSLIAACFFFLMYAQATTGTCLALAIESHSLSRTVLSTNPLFNYKIVLFANAMFDSISGVCVLCVNER